jgi:hypothetical protein
VSWVHHEGTKDTEDSGAVRRDVSFRVRRGPERFFLWVSGAALPKPPKKMIGFLLHAE